MNLLRPASSIAGWGELVCPPILPVPATAGRPFWSVMIPSYNHAEFLGSTLRSVLEQDPGPDDMQIEVLDDCSTQDDPEAVVKAVGGGRVAFYRHPHNVGMSANWNACISRARGRWVHILHDDDMVLPQFYRTCRSYIESNPRAILVFSRVISVDENDEWVHLLNLVPNGTTTGIIPDPLREFAQQNFIRASAAVVARAAYEKVGGFNPGLVYCPDWEMWIRITDVGRIAYIHQPYVLYRDHPGSATRTTEKFARHLEESIYATEFGVQKLPVQLQREYRSRARRKCSALANFFRWSQYLQGENQSAVRFSFLAFQLHPSVGNLLRVVKTVGWLMRGWLLLKAPRASD